MSLVTGLATALHSIVVSVLIRKIEWDDAEKLERDFAILEQIKLAIGFFMLPGLVVAIGSYIHAVKRKGWGQMMLAAGSLFPQSIFFVTLLSLSGCRRFYLY